MLTGIITYCKDQVKYHFAMYYNHMIIMPYFFDTEKKRGLPPA